MTHTSIWNTSMTQWLQNHSTCGAQLWHNDMMSWQISLFKLVTILLHICLSLPIETTMTDSHFKVEAEKWGTILSKLLLGFSVTTVNTKSQFPWSSLIHSTTDLTHNMKATGTAVSVPAIKTYRGAEVQLYLFLSLAVGRCELSASYVSSGGTDTVFLE